MITKAIAGCCALLVALFLWGGGDCFSAQPDTDSTRTTHSVRISGQAFPLAFGDQNVTEGVKERMAADLQHAFAGSTSVVLRARGLSRVDSWHGHPVTHRLCEQRSGKFYQINSTTFPPLLREQFGYAVIVDSEPHLIIIEELLATYTNILRAVERHPRMVRDMKKYIALLQNPAELEKIASDQEEAREFVYCYRVSVDTGQAVLRSYVRDLSAGHELAIKQRSLFDIVRLSDVFVDENTPDDVYIVSAVVSGQETPGSKPFAERLPLGAYVEGKWRLFAWPMP